MSRIRVISLAFFAAAQGSAILEALAATGHPPSSTTQYLPVVLAVTLNGLPEDLGTVFLRDEGGNLFAPMTFLGAMNLRPGALRVMAADGGEYFELGKLPGVSYRWDHERVELAISAAPKAFVSTRINAAGAAGRTVAPYSPGGYLNYDLSLNHSVGTSTAQALFDLGLFRGVGLLTSSFTTGTAGSARLMSTYQTDRVDAIKSLRIGDSFNHTGAWGRGVLFGGIQYGTNFAIRPDFIPIALPGVTGQALLPSTVDVYVNNVLRSRQQVNSGPFSIQNLPVITGAGEMQVVVKDLLGREQVITQPFFASPSLLREGLVEDAYEWGWLRQNYGLSSNAYGHPFGTATYRRGLSNQLTGEGRIELQKDLVAAGFSATTALPGISSVVESTVAVGRVRGSAPGMMGSVAYSYLGRRWSASARVQLNSLRFRQVGSDPVHLLRQVGTVQFSAPLAKGTVSVNYLRHQNQGEILTRIINLAYSQRLTDGLFASFQYVKPLASPSGTSVGLVLTAIFDQNHYGSATVNNQAGATTLYTEYRQATPNDDGFGYRGAVLTGGHSRRQEASLMRNPSFGRLQAELVHDNGEISSRLSAQGGLAALGGGVFVTRGMDEGFAVVQTKGIAGVPIYLENQVVAHTDPGGRAVVGNLQPYQPNHIRIDPVTLPMAASVGEVEQTVIPRSRGGVIVDFDVRFVRHATLKIVLADGQPLPAWTPVEVVGSQEAFVSGNRGEVSVNLPKAIGNRVIARPAGGPACELTVDLPDSPTSIPFLGPLTCATSP
jgi:outer membrane usher protein